MCVCVSLLSYAYYNVWSSLRALHHIKSRSKGCLSYQGECVEYCVSHNRNMFLPKKVCVL